jgi:hypothetical protein
MAVNIMILSSGIVHRVVWYISINISVELSASIFRVEGHIEY